MSQENISYGVITEKVRRLNIDALPRMIRERNSMLKMAWLLLLLSSCALCCYLIFNSIVKFTSHQVTTTVRYITEQKHLAPTLTFCNINPFTSQYASDLLHNANATSDADESADYWLQYLQIEDYVWRTRGTYLTVEEKLKLTDFTMMFNDTNDLPDRLFHPTYFGCARWNANATALMPGYGTVQSFCFHTGGNNVSISKMSLNNIKGFYVFIQNADDYPLGTLRSPLIATAGLDFKAIIKARRLYHQHSHPYSECGVLEDNSLVVDLNDRYVFDEVVKTGSAFSRHTCFEFCTQLMTSQMCECNSKRVDFKVNNVTECSISAELSCVKSLWQDYQSVNDFCFSKCPLECSRSIYDVNTNIKSSTFDQFVSLYFSSYAMQFDKLVQITISTDSLSYVETTEEPKTSGEDLLGIIGGYLHIFLGKLNCYSHFICLIISFLTLIN